MKTRLIPALAVIAVAALSACTTSPSATPTVVDKTIAADAASTPPASVPTVVDPASSPASTPAAQTQSSTPAASASATPGASAESNSPAKTTRPAPGDFKTYQNSRSGYAVKYPQWMTMAEADNGDGIKVTAPTGGQMLTWTEPTPDTYAGELQALKDAWAGAGVTVTSAKDLGTKGVHLVAIQDKQTMERRYMFGEVDGEPTAAVMQWTYDTTMKATYADMVKACADSLTAPHN